MRFFTDFLSPFAKCEETIVVYIPLVRSSFLSLFLHVKKEVYFTHKQTICYVRGADESSSLMGCYAVQNGEQLPTFRNIIHLLCQTVQGRPRMLDAEQKSVMLLRNFG